MRTLTCLAFALASSLPLVAGCSADAASSTSDSNLTDGVPDGISAAATLGSVRQDTGKCHVDVVTVDARVASAEVTKKLNDALKFDVQKELEFADCSRPTELTGAYEVSYNRWNLLSVAFTGYYNTEGAAHPSHLLKTWNFDLQTGEVIDLREVLDLAGLQIVVDACKSDDKMKGFEDACESAVRHEPVWRIEMGGLRIHPVDVANAAWELGEQGAEITWMQLNGHFKQSPLQQIAP